MEGDLKLAHLRILLAILSAMQDVIRRRIRKGKEESVDFDSLRILSVPLSEFNIGPHNGMRLRQYLKELQSKSIAFPDKSFQGLITGFSYPGYARHIEICLSQEMIMCLLNLKDGFTSYSLHTASSLTGKYTLRIYWLISSWKNRGGFVIHIDEFRRLLSLGTSYYRTDNITTHILGPAADELKAVSPIWFRFNVAHNNIVFKIKIIATEQKKRQARMNAWDTCFRLATVIGIPLQSIAPIFERVEYEDLRLFVRKFSMLAESLRGRPDVNNPEAYVQTVLTKWLDNLEQRYSE